jgi:hypothetical protein
MDNPETKVALNTQTTGRKLTKQNNTDNIKDEQHGLYKNQGEPRYSREVSSSGVLYIGHHFTIL